MHRLVLPAIAALSLAAPALAAGSPPAPCSAPEYHQWDFWLGAWTVTDPDGKLQGTNEIVRSRAGCALEEHWRNTGAGGGDSFNVYDPARKTWTQLWSGTGSIVRLEGRLDDKGAMRMEGLVTDQSGTAEHRFRGVWTPLPGGAVRQEFFEQDPKTGAWSNWFTGIYRKRG